MRILELFSGTGSVGKVCKKLGYDEIISVDLILPATHSKTDIMTFDYKQYDKNYFDIVWASPPCTAYSHLQNSWIGRTRKNGDVITKEKIEEMRKESDKLVEKTLEIIKYFNPEKWFMENPATGNLKNRDVVKDLLFYDVDYCMYSDWGYRKRTRVWTNVDNFKPKRCDGSGACGNMVMLENKKHLHQANLGNGGQTRAVKNHYKKQNRHKTQVVPSKTTKGATSQLERYRIPERLIFDLFNEEYIK